MCRSTVDDVNPAWTLNYGNHGIFLIMGNAGFVSSAVVHALRPDYTQTVRSTGYCSLVGADVSVNLRFRDGSLARARCPTHLPNDRALRVLTLNPL